jgi:lipopolysaccharide/colanic/teichoic acid biosynthesis glycosyltransferase
MQDKRLIIDCRPTGYAKVSSVLNGIFNFSMSLIIILFSLPVFLILSLIIKLQDRGPVFYKGVRLGLNKKPFIMYKFRTLVPDAEKLIGAEILSSKHKLETLSGRFLRDTRLDELPQLINILRGDMDFLGPRPERPVIYEKFCKHIKGYDKRFSVKPGLIGYSQLFTPHSAPKKIRTLIDNTLLKSKQNFISDLSLIFFTILIVTRTVIYKMAKYIWRDLLKSKVLRLYKEKRVHERMRPKEAKVFIGSKIGEQEVFTDEAQLIDVNEEAFLIYSNHKINSDNAVFKLQINHESGRGNRKRKKTAICTGEIYRETEINSSQAKYAYVIRYTPISPLNHYVLHTYFLSQSMSLI